MKINLELSAPLINLHTDSIPPANRFGAIRKHDIHTGVDLFTPEGSHVFSMCAGIVYEIGQFTGPEAGSPWWNSTQYIVIKTGKFFILYGEIEVSKFWEVGKRVYRWDYLGKVQTVLKKDKGLPMSMLHLELYSKYETPVVWELDTPKPVGLEDPSILLDKLKENNQHGNKDL